MDVGTITALERIRYDIEHGRITTAGEIAERLANVASAVAGPLVIPRVAPSEPPIASKVSYSSQLISRAITHRNYIADILLAAAIFDYNQALLGVSDLENRVIGLADTVKTLYFFSSPSRAGVHVVYNDFRAGLGEFVQDGPAALAQDYSSGLTLPILSKNSVMGITTIETDGIHGTFYLLDDDGNLVADYRPRNNALFYGDGDPSTIYECERYWISPETQANTRGYGFGFTDSEVKWASPEYSDLSATILVEFNSATPINYMWFVPGLTSNNYTVKSITLYSGGKEVSVLSPKNLQLNPSLLMHAHEDYYNYGAYHFEAVEADKAIIELYCNTAVDCSVRHAYELDEETNVRIPSTSPHYFAPHSVIQQFSNSDDLRKVEDLPAKRYAMGIRDIIIERITYATEGFLASRPFQFHRPIDRIALEANYQANASTDVEFSVSFDGGTEWHTIAPLGETVFDQIIAVNDMVPSAYQDPSTKYIVVDGEPTQFQARITMKRSKTKSNNSAVIRSVKYEVTLK